MISRALDMAATSTRGANYVPRQVVNYVCQPDTVSQTLSALPPLPSLTCAQVSFSCAAGSGWSGPRPGRSRVLQTPTVMMVTTVAASPDSRTPFLRGPQHAHSSDRPCNQGLTNMAE